MDVICPAGTPARCNRCNAAFVTTEEIKVNITKGSRVGRMLDMVTAPCGHRDCHWVIFKEETPK